MYRDTSRDVVAAAGVQPGATVLDLCCGTGVTTEALLEVVGPDGRIVAVDGSAAMLVEAQRRVADPRVEFNHSPAENIAGVVPDAVDAVVCNSAIWQTDIEQVITAMERVLRPGGSVAFNVGRRFLIMPFTAEELAPRSPGLSELALAIAILDHDFMPPMVGRGGGGQPLTPGRIEEMLKGAGLVPGEPRVVQYPMPAQQMRAWLSIPVFSQQTPGRGYAEKMKILDAAYERLKSKAAESSRWLIFSAQKR